MLRIRKIVCPVDFSALSHAALDRAVAMAAAGDAEICVVHVQPPLQPVTPSIDGFAAGAEAASYGASSVKNLCAVVEEHVPSHIRARPLLRQGLVAAEIARTACEEEADLIVMTGHGASGSRVETLGAIAEAVLGLAPCPVLVVNQPARQSANAQRPDISANLRSIETDVVEFSPATRGAVAVAPYTVAVSAGTPI